MAAKAVRREGRWLGFGVGREGIERGRGWAAEAHLERGRRVFEPKEVGDDGDWRRSEAGKMAVEDDGDWFGLDSECATSIPSARRSRERWR
jgi:hypothetical protein